VSGIAGEVGWVVDVGEHEVGDVVSGSSSGRWGERVNRLCGWSGVREWKRQARGRMEARFGFVR